MATLGKWSGGVTTLIPTTTFAAPNAMFPTQDRNDGSVYTFTSSTSTLTLPSSGLADGYLIVAAFEFQDTSNGRHNPQGHIIQASGTGTFVGGPTSGFNRDTSEDRSYIRCWAFVDGPSASATFQFQWKRDGDTPTGGTERSEFQVIPFFYADIGLYTSTVAALFGGTTPNQVTGWSGTDGTNITLSSNVVSITGDNKRYLVFGSQFDEVRNGRTQRWRGLEIDNTQENAAKGCSYIRNTSNDETGSMFTWLLETSTATITIEQTCYLGDGVGSGQGGADADGSLTPTVGDHTLVVIELNDSAEVFRNTGSSNQNIATTGPIDITIAQVPDIDFNDAASFTRASDIAMNCEQAMDVLLGANISAASQAITSGARFTGFAEFTVNGTEDIDSVAGNYLRGNQSSNDTFGWSANLLNFQAVAANDDVGVSATELSGSEGGGGAVHIQTGWAGFWGINLDSLSVTDTVLSAETGSYLWTGQAATLLHDRLLSAEAGSYLWTGQTANLLKDFTLTAEPGSYIWTGQAAELLRNRLLSAEAGSYAWTGQDAALLRSLLLSAEAGSYLWTGQDAGLFKTFVLSAEAGSYAWTGQEATLLVDRILSADAGSYIWTGQAANLLRSLVLTAEAGSYSWTGQAAELLRTRLLNADPGSYLWTGQDAGLLRTLLLTAEPGAYLWTGQEASLIRGSVLSAEAGSYLWTGQAANLLRDLALTAETGSYLWTGQAATLRRDLLFTAETGSYLWTGQASELLRDLVLTAESGSYLWTGQNAELLRSLVFAADPGSYLWTGQDATLVTQGTLMAEPGSYLWTGQDAALIFTPSGVIPVSIYPRWRRRRRT